MMPPVPVSRTEHRDTAVFTEMAAQTRTFKIALIGADAVGKTALVKRHLTGAFEPRYLATIGTEVRPLKFSTNLGDVELQLWDCAGQPLYAGLRDGYYIGAKAALVMFDVTRPETYQQARDYVRDFQRVCPGAPVVICGHKVDVKDRRVHPRDISLHREVSDIAKSVSTLPADAAVPSAYFDTSAKSNYNFEKPFLWLARQLTGDASLQFVESTDDDAEEEPQEDPNHPKGFQMTFMQGDEEYTLTCEDGYAFLG